MMFYTRQTPGHSHVHHQLNVIKRLREPLSFLQGGNFMPGDPVEVCKKGAKEGQNG